MLRCRVLVATLVAAAAMAAGACSDSKDEKPPAEAPFSGRGSEQFCAAARDYNDRYTRAFVGDVFAAISNPDNKAARDKLREDLKAAIALGRDLERKAPAEIRDDFRASIGSADRYYAALEKVDFNVARLDPQSKELNDPKTAEATARLSRYYTDVCKIAVPASLGR